MWFLIIACLIFAIISAYMLANRNSYRLAAITLIALTISLRALMWCVLHTPIMMRDTFIAIGALGMVEIILIFFVMQGMVVDAIETVASTKRKTTQFKDE